MKYFLGACAFAVLLVTSPAVVDAFHRISWVKSGSDINSAAAATTLRGCTTPLPQPRSSLDADENRTPPRYIWDRRARQRGGRPLQLSGTGSTMMPPPVSRATRYGGGEDGIRVLTPEENKSAVLSFADGAKRYRRGDPAKYKEYIGMLQEMWNWGKRLEVKRVGCKRLILGNIKGGKLCCIVAAEIMWRGGLNRDVRICLRLIVVNPMYDTREIGFETVNEIKSFGTANALLLDVSPLMEVPSQRMFCLAVPKTLDEDPERVFKDPLIQQYYSRVRRSCYVLDGIPDWADLGPYWYEGALRRSVSFFFRKRLKAVNEYEVTLQRPGAGLSTGSGTVGGARVISIDEAEASHDIPGHLKVREIERRLSNRLLEEMQGENPVLSD